MAPERTSTVNISLPESLREFVQARAAQRCSSVSEYIRELVREDERRARQDTVLDALTDGTAVVPGIWASEVANVLVMKERSNRLTPCRDRLASHLPLQTSDCGRLTEGPFTFSVVSNVARERALTVYDAHYLELATRLELPLASLDQELLRAASEASVELVGNPTS